MVRRAVSEGLGSCLLVATVVGSGIMAERLAAGNGAVALLANSLATAGILYVLIAMLAPISGAHFNPAVSLVGALDRTLAWPLLGIYVGVQIAGAVAGTALAHAMFDLPAFVLSGHRRFGPGQWLGEGIATFGLVLTILGLARSRPKAVAAAVALYIGAAYWFTSSTSFANPAVTIARALTDTFSGIAPQDAPYFIAAQFAGALAAMPAARLLWARADRVNENVTTLPARSLRESA